uniref:Uncharacterized protein n=1 Tax=Leptobrachium leishanense TaxID=445787 RepID=A0A8C5QKB0_9ANUR
TPTLPDCDKGGRMSFQLPLPLPLPKILIIFSLGDWSFYTIDSRVSAQLVTGGSQPQLLGTLSADCRCLVWEGEWNTDVILECAKMASQGIPAKLLLTVTGQVAKCSGFSSSTPAKRRLSVGPPSSPLLSESAIVPVRPSDMALEVTVSKVSPPLKTALILPAHNGDCEAGGTDTLRRMSDKPRNARRLRFGSKDSLGAGSQGPVRPSARSGHSICLCDPDTAILIGGEGDEERPCKDAFWKMELDSDFWFPMDGICQGPPPQATRGHSATFDPESKKVYVYGGMRESRRFSCMYILDTLDWKWTLVTAMGKVPTLSYHSATMYQRELYVFGGLWPQPSTESGSCTNALYIFNPEYKIWYQPMVEGMRPLARFGHSATLLRNFVVIFGGKRTPSPIYLNDLHILDLGYMEYSSVSLSSNAEKPTARCFHSAIPVSDNNLLIHGGLSSVGPLGDAFIFSLDTLSWSPIKFGDAPEPSRYGHTLLNLTSSYLTDTEKEKRKGRSTYSVMIIGGTDGSGNFYCDTPKFHLDVTPVHS